MFIPFDPTISASLDYFVYLSEEVADPQMRSFWTACRRLLESYIFDDLIPKPQYENYIQSEVWTNKKREFIRFFGLACAICNAQVPLSVHHRTYDRLGHEFLSDCIPLCDECHRFADAQRVKATHRASSILESG